MYKLQELEGNTKNQQTLVVSAKIQGIPWESQFVVGVRKDTFWLSQVPYFDKDTLTKSILPYFESIEDYEFCSEIMRINNEI